MTAVGTREWVEQTGGKLAFTERWTMIAQAVLARAARTRTVRVRHREVDDVRPPDSAIAVAALGMSEALCPPYLHHHNLRAYFWARLLDPGTEPVDDEALFVALMLHDLGLGDARRLVGDAEECFTVVGARAALALGAAHGWSDARAELAAQAITLHLGVTVAPRYGREAVLVRTGSGADAAGLGLRALAEDQIAAVLARYPRLDCKRALVATLAEEARDRPRCRAALLMRLGFADLVQAAPMFDE